MAAANALQMAHIFARCAVDPPRFPDELAAMDLFEAYQGAAQAVRELDKAVNEHPLQADTRGEFPRAASLSSNAIRPMPECC